MDEATITMLKAKFPDRTLHSVEIGDGEDGGELYQFIITGPTATEYKKYQDEMLEARAKGKDKEQMEAAQSAIRRAALAQIRYPERAEVERLFEMKPGLISHFGEELPKAAGETLKVRSKKL